MIRWTIYRQDIERRSLNLTAVYRGAAEALSPPLSAVLRVRPLEGGAHVDFVCTTSGGGTAPLEAEATIAPLSLAAGAHRAWLIVTWGDGPRTWPDPERDGAIAITVLDRP